MTRITLPNLLTSILKSELFKQILLISIGLIVALPVLIALFASFKSPNEVTDYPPNLIPREWTFQSYVNAWNGIREFDPDSVGIAGFIDNNFRTWLPGFPVPPG